MKKNFMLEEYEEGERLRGLKKFTMIDDIF
jgi:hypothetical protein